MSALINVAGQRIPLERGRDYVLGRAEDCEIVVPDPAVSQRHAQLSVAPAADVVFIDDLGSRNGTYLDESRVRTRSAVGDGSRLRLGSSLFLLRVKDEADDIARGATGTVPFDPGGMDPAIDGGEMSRYGLLNLLRLLHTFRSDVTANIALPNAIARVEVRQGDVLSADFAGLSGLNALVQLGRQKGGIFWLVETTAECPRNISLGSEMLLAQLGECLDVSAGR